MNQRTLHLVKYICVFMLLHTLQQYTAERSGRIHAVAKPRIAGTAGACLRHTATLQLSGPVVPEAQPEGHQPHALLG